MKISFPLRFKSVGLLLLMTILCSNVWAQDENNTVYIRLTNTSLDHLIFKRVISCKPGNTFTVDTPIINPGATATITAVKQLNNDVIGSLLFANQKGDTALLRIVDQQQYHFGQPLFSFNGSQYRSTLLSTTRNKNVGPRFLTIVAAEVRITSSQIF